MEFEPIQQAFGERSSALRYVRVKRPHITESVSDRIYERLHSMDIEAGGPRGGATHFVIASP